MAKSSGRRPVMRLRMPTVAGQPPLGAIILNRNTRAKYAYRVISAEKVAARIAQLGVTTWRVHFERLSVPDGMADVRAGHPHLWFRWDSRCRKQKALP